MIEARDYIDEFCKLFKAKNREPEFVMQGKEKIKGEYLHKCAVKDESRTIAIGYGKTHRDAKKDCARKALEVYRGEEFLWLL